MPLRRQSRLQTSFPVRAPPSAAPPATRLDPSYNDPPSITDRADQAVVDAPAPEDRWQFGTAHEARIPDAWATPRCRSSAVIGEAPVAR